MNINSENTLDNDLERAECLINKKLGIIYDLYPYTVAPNMPKVLYGYQATRRSIKDENNKQWAHVLTPGTAYKQSPIKAKMAAIGECIERYCCTITDGHETLESSFEDLTEPAVDPSSFTCFTDEQYAIPNFPYKPFQKDTEIKWVRGFSLTKQESSWVPADLTFLPSPQPWNIRFQISNGLACGSSLWHACYAALCELIERDAFTIMWLMDIEFPRINHHSIPNKNTRNLISELERYGIKITINDLTLSSGIPVFTVIGETEWKWPKFVISAHAALDPISALNGALEEVFAIYNDLSLNERAIYRKEDIKTFEDNFLYYASGENKDEYQFLLEAPLRNFDNNLWIKDIPESYESKTKMIVDILDREGCEVLCVDLTTEDVGQAGFHVIRAIIPQFQSLYHKYPMLECERMWNIANLFEKRGENPEYKEFHAFP